MVAYFLRRLLISIIIFFSGITVVFFIIHIIPGDPVSNYVNPYLPEEVKQHLVETFGLNKPLIIQYFNWILNLFKLDFGYSLVYSKPVILLIKNALLPTIFITTSGLVFGTVIGCILGVFSAVRKNTIFDKLSNIFVIVFYSLPSFWTGVLLSLIFSYTLGLFPSSQLKSLYHDQLNVLERTMDYLYHATLPILSLGLSIMAVFAKYTRESMIKSLSSSFVVGALGRGINRKRILFKYCFKNALIPIINLIGTATPFIIGGAVTVEVVFSLPGMGRLLVSSALSRDYPVIMAITTIVFMAVIMVNFFIDIILYKIDPRVGLNE